MNLLEFANSILTGKTVAKAEAPTHDPDKPTPGAMSEEEMAAARTEAQSAQQAQAAAAPDGTGGAPGAPGPDGTPEHEGAESPAAEAAEHANGEEEPDEVTKADILKSIHFLANEYKITPDEITKSFSGGEGDPTQGKEPVGKGIEFLEALLNRNTDILTRMASFMEELAGHTVKLEANVAKAMETSEVTKALAEKAIADVQALPRIAEAKPAKGITAEEIVAKSLANHGSGVGGGEKKLDGASLFAMAMDPKCPLSPQEIAQANRASQGTYGS